MGRRQPRSPHPAAYWVVLTWGFHDNLLTIAFSARPCRAMYSNVRIAASATREEAGLEVIFKPGFLACCVAD